MKKGLSLKNVLFVLVILIVGVFLVIKNCKNTTFFDATLIQILTLLVTVTLSFFFVQHLTDKRRKVDCYEHILVKVQKMIDSDTRIFSVEKEALVLQKSVANKIKHLKEHAFPKVKRDLEYIEVQFEELRDLYGNHKQSSDELKRVEADMIKHKTNISDKIDKIILELYDL